MTVADTIKNKLEAALAPEKLEIIDESHLHAGHVGARPEGETHFRVAITAAAFAGESRVNRQRRVYQILAAEMAGPVHALAMTALTPDEAARRA